MMDTFKYAAANAAVRAGFARLLSDDTWKALLSAEDVERFVSVAAGTAYGKVLADLSGADVETVENRLRGYRAGQFRLPLPFLSGKARELVDWLWRPFEINNLVILIRALHNGVPAARVRSSMIRLGPASALDWNGLGNTRSIPDAITRMQTSLAGRFYARALQNAMHEYQRQDRVFVLEVALYLAYYRRLRDLMGDLSGRDRKEAERLVGTLIDSRNILWAYRYHLFFRLKPETILGYTLPRGGRVGASMIQWAATGAPLPELLRYIWDDRLPDMDRIEERPPREALSELEMIFRRYLLELANQAMAAYPLQLGTILAYLVCLDAEVDDLIAIAEGVSYRWPSERICTCLIGDRGRT